MERAEEASLVRRVADGDRAAFAVLLQTHQRPLQAYTRRMLRDPDLADDMVQETFLRLWARAASYDPASARLTTWLHNIAHNLCIDSFRRAARMTYSDDENLSAAVTEGPERHEADREQSEQVKAALEVLPERQRSALLLCHYQGLSNRDAAQILDVSVDALESLLARARRRLRKEVETDDER